MFPLEYMALAIIYVQRVNCRVNLLQWWSLSVCWHLDYCPMSCKICAQGKAESLVHYMGCAGVLSLIFYGLRAQYAFINRDRRVQSVFSQRSMCIFFVAKPADLCVPKTYVISVLLQGHVRVAEYIKKLQFLPASGFDQATSLSFSDRLCKLHIMESSLLHTKNN